MRRSVAAQLCQRPLDHERGGRCQRRAAHAGPCMLSLVAHVVRWHEGPSDLEYMLSVPGGETWRCGLMKLGLS